MTLRLKTALWLLACMIACLLLVAFVYWSGLAGEFMLDDGANIIYPYIDNPGWRATLYIVTHNGSGMLGRSVSILSFVLTGLQYGLEPWGYKYHNLLLHLLNGVLLFYLLLQILPVLDRQLEKNRVLLVAGITTTLWLLHPLQASTVLYAVQRMTQLSAFFTLLALLAYVKARLSEVNTWRFHGFGWVLFPLFTGLALLSKENGALIPVYALALEFLVFRPTVPELRANRRLALFVGVFVAVPLLLGAALLIFGFDSLINYNGRSFSLQERLLTEVHVLFFYMRLIFLPRLRDMSLFHDDYAIVSTLGPVTIVLMGVLLLMLVAIWRLRRSWPVVAFGLAWFLISHLLESTVFPLELVFEHRNYLALAGLLLIPGYAVFKLDQTRMLRWLCPLVIAGLSLMTSVRAAEWGEPEVFYRVARTEHPGSPRALNNYLNFLISRSRYGEAMELLEKQVELTPDQPGAWLHLQVVLCGRGTRSEEGLQKVRESFGQRPVSVYGLNGLQSLMNSVVEDRCPVVSLEEVEVMIDDALAYIADHPHPANQAYLLRMRGIVAFRNGYYAQGYAYFRMAHELSGEIDLLAELARYQLQMGNLRDAEETLILIEQQNAERFGIDQYQLDLAREMVEEARRRMEQAPEPQAP